MKSIGWDTSFHLNGKFPLLDNSIFPSLNAAKLFVSDPTSSAIAGTIIGVDDPSNSNETGLYEIFNNSGELALRKLVSEGTLASYKTKIDSLITDLSGNYSSELAELAAQQAKQLETLRDEMFSPDNNTTPVTRTMMLQVGADSTNYRFSTNEIGSKDTDGVVFNSSDKSLTFLSGTLYHFSITDSSGKPRTWSIPNSMHIELDGTENILGSYINLLDYINKGESLWIYLKVPKTGLQGNWLLSPTKYGCILDDTQSPGEGISLGNTAYYYLLYGYCGVTSSEIPFFEPVYGNTWIKGSTIYTGKVQTMDGYSALDLDNNTLKLGNDFYYADGQVVVGNPDTGAFVFHKHGDDTALHVGTMTKDSDGTESWNGMTFADGELTIGKYEEKLQEIQTQLDKEVSTWYGQGIPLPYKENNESNTVDSVAPELAASYNETLTTDENGIKMFNLSPNPEPLPRHINDIYINSITGVGYRLVVSNWGEENQQVYWLQLSQWDLQNILQQLNNVNSEVNNIKTALNITEDGQTTIGDKFIETMMLRIGADSTNYTLSKTSTSGNRMQNLQWSVDDSNVKLNVSEGENLHHSVYYWTDPKDNSRRTYDWVITKPTTSIINVSKTSTIPYYLYIKCSKTSNTAEWFATEIAKSLQDSLWYYFPFGTVVDPSTQALVEVRGNTKIIGDRIITGKLESNTGNSFFDLDNGQFALGIDQNNPNDLDKAAFSFDGSTVHIGSTAMFDTQSKLANIDSTYVLEGPHLANQIKTFPLLHLLDTKGSSLYRIENGLQVSVITDTGSIVLDTIPNYMIFLATDQYSIGQEGVEIWPTDVSLLTSGKVFQGKDGYSIYILWGASNQQFEEYKDFTLGELSEQLASDFLHDAYNYNLLIDPIHIRYYDEDEQLFPMFSTTEISGGLVLTNVLGVKNSYGNISAGICGINDSKNTVAFWAGGNLDVKEESPVKITFSGIGSQIGPLSIKDDNIIQASNGNSYCKIRTDSDSAKIEIQDNLENTLSLEASDVDVNLGNLYKVNTSWETSSIEQKQLKPQSSDVTEFILSEGTVNFNRVSNTSLYTETISSYNTYPATTTIQFTGDQPNTSNTFGLVAYIDLYIAGKYRTTLATIDKPISEYSKRKNGLPNISGNSRAFQANFKADDHTGIISLEDNGEKYSIKLRIKELSRWWTGGTGTTHVSNYVAAEKEDYDQWTIDVVSQSSLKVKSTYSAVLKDMSNSGSVGIPPSQGLISPKGFSFSYGSSRFAASVGDKSTLYILLSGLPKDSGATPLGIDGKGHLCRIN